MRNHSFVSFLLLLGLALTIPATAADDSKSEQVYDPMQPTWLRGGSSGTPERTREQRFTVDTIVVSPERRVAIINGRSVSVGEWVNGAKVLRIDPAAVVLELDGARFTIALAITDIKKASRNGG